MVLRSTTVALDEATEEPLSWRCTTDDIGRLLQLAVDPYDARHLPVTAFPPSLALLAGLGHLVRARIDPTAWLREAGFRMDILGIELLGPPPALASIQARMEGLHAIALDYIEFAYGDLEEEGYRRYMVHRLTRLDGPAVEALVEQDCVDDEPVLAQHAAAVEEAFSRFLTERLGVPIEAAVDFRFEVRGLAYDDGAPLVSQRPRSDIEAPVRRRWPIGRLVGRKA
jgi:hypothetical protein